MKPRTNQYRQGLQLHKGEFNVTPLTAKENHFITTVCDNSANNMFILCQRCKRLGYINLSRCMANE